MTLKPCLTCGAVSAGSRCPEHQAEQWRQVDQRRGNARQRGYDSRWRRTSRRARHLQQFCSLCGATTNLQADHRPGAWQRAERGLPLRLGIDVDVLCGPCNVVAGPTRGRNPRQRPPETPNPGKNAVTHRRGSGSGVL